MDLNLLERVGAGAGLSDGMIRVLAGILVVLAVGTAVRGIALWRRRSAEAREGWQRVGTWWLLALLVITVVALGRSAVALATGCLSLAVLREALALVGHRSAAAFAPGPLALVAAVYTWAWLDWRSLYLVALPICGFALVVLLAVLRVVSTGERVALARRGGLLHAVGIAVIGPSFLVGVGSLPAPASLPEAGLGWMVLLLVLTALNDAAQAWWGRTLGSHPMAPTLSPHKTWEGLVGGVATTGLAAVELGPLVTDLGRTTPLGGALGGPAWLWWLGIGLLVGLAGTAGDLAASSLKRRAGVKDSGDALPGHGGFLDRLDSTSVAAPVFFFVTYLLWIGP